jgi:SagB-type dehydrogenase family enzyme
MNAADRLPSGAAASPLGALEAARPPEGVHGAVARRYLELGESLAIPGEVHWDDAPGPFKLYRGHPRIPLGPCELGRLLADSYSLTRVRWTASDALRRVMGTRGASRGPSRRRLDTTLLRPVASGGALFPGELYVLAGAGASVPSGVYHYDPAHHALVRLRSEDPSAALAGALGSPEAPLPAITILLSVFFWKNAFKYGGLSYRLCSIDAGALLGQLLVVAAREAPASVRYQFVDDELEALLALDPQREAVYAALLLSPAASGPCGEAVRVSRAAGHTAPPEPPPGRAIVAAHLPPRTNGRSPLEASWSIEALPLQAELHRAARLLATSSFVPASAAPPADLTGVRMARSILLPEQRVGLLEGLRRRRSSMGYFEPGEIPLGALGALLAATTTGYLSDINEPAPHLRHTALFLVVNQVAGLSPGVYHYRADRHALDPVRTGNLRSELQATLLASMFNLHHASLCVYPVGDYASGFAAHGDRWYRIQNMEAGLVLERLYLAAAALGLRCHTNLGYSAERTHRLLGLSGSRLRALIQLVVGFGREPGDYYETDCA